MKAPWAWLPRSSGMNSSAATRTDRFHRDAGAQLSEAPAHDPPAGSRRRCVWLRFKNFSDFLACTLRRRAGSAGVPWPLSEAPRLSFFLHDSSPLLRCCPPYQVRINRCTLPEKGAPAMKTMKFTYWKDGNFYLGFWNDYPDYQTQGMSKEELVSNLKDLLADLESGEVPYIRKVEELVVAG